MSNDRVKVEVKRMEGGYKTVAEFLMGKRTKDVVLKSPKIRFDSYTTIDYTRNPKMAPKNDGSLSDNEMQLTKKTTVVYNPQGAPVAYVVGGKCIQYEKIYAKKGASYRQEVVKSYSHYNDPIDSTKSISGNSRVHGDATHNVQKKVINEIITQAKNKGFNKEEVCLLLAIAYTESGFNPDAAAGTTSASGIGQFVKKTGAEYGLMNTAHFFDYKKNISALIKYYLYNKNLALQRGQDPMIYIYKYHHDGPSGEYGGLSLVYNHILPLQKKFSKAICNKLEIEE